MPPQLSFDIQVAIIKRLPVKSLIQFRSVCKAWKSLIDSSQFIAGYNFRHDQSEHLLVRLDVGDREKREVKYVSFVDDDSFPQQKFALTVPPLVQETEIVIGSSHGLLCLTEEYYPTSRTSMAVLWNPTIRKSISVTVPPNVVHHLFDFVLGFGVCPDTKDPKLVKITYISDHRKMESISCIPCQVMVFTLSSGEWKTSCSNVPRKSIEFENGFSNSTVIGQFIYWLASDWNVVDGEFRNLILSFDLSTEEFREIETPDNCGGSCLLISRVRESLVLLDERTTSNNQFCDVWMMEHGDSKAFTKQFTIKAPDASVFGTMGFRKSGEPIIEMQDDDDEDEHDYVQCALAVYEPCLEHIKDLGIRGDIHSFFVSSYTESLLLLDHEDGHIIKCGAVKTEEVTLEQAN